ncbi:MAG: type II toxin-antitoxin system VapC family toxin [Saccharolobus sp.]|jgi:predicted nucleic acid-binding protein
MSLYVFDTSAIINIIQKYGSKSIDIFKKAKTADLALYEIGNFLWKIRKSELVEDFINTLKFIEIERIGLNKDVIQLAINESLTYYDAVYLFLSRKYNLQLVSDDRDLLNKGAIESDKITI